MGHLKHKECPKYFTIKKPPIYRNQSDIENYRYDRQHRNQMQPLKMRIALKQQINQWPTMSPEIWLPTKSQRLKQTLFVQQISLVLH